MKRWIFGAVLIAAVALYATASRSDVTTVSAGSAAPPLPSGSAADVPGPDLGQIPYSAMSPAEQAVIDNGRDTTAWAEVGDTYAAAAREQAQRAAASAAALQLGVDDVSQQGVVP